MFILAGTPSYLLGTDFCERILQGRHSSNTRQGTRILV